MLHRFRRYRHLRSRKLNHKEISKLFGDRYEHYVAELMRGDGWQVDERTNLGFDDEGIDLTASRENVVCYVQCKGWADDKFIHENVIDQLYGSAMYQAKLPTSEQVEIRLYTSALISETAHLHALKLGIQILSVPIPVAWNKRDFYESDLAPVVINKNTAS
jgi:hypothetical protein